MNQLVREEWSGSGEDKVIGLKRRNRMFERHA